MSSGRLAENLFRTLCNNIQNHKNDQFVTTLIVQLVQPFLCYKGNYNRRLNWVWGAFENT